MPLQRAAVDGSRRSQASRDFAALKRRERRAPGPERAVYGALCSGARHLCRFNVRRSMGLAEVRRLPPPCNWGTR